MCVCARLQQWKQWWSLQPPNTQTCELWISALHNSTLISWAKDTHSTHSYQPAPITMLWYSLYLHTHTHYICLSTHNVTAMASWAQATHTSTGTLLRCLSFMHNTHTSVRKEPIVQLVFPKWSPDHLIITRNKILTGAQRVYPLSFTKYPSVTGIFKFEPIGCWVRVQSWTSRRRCLIGCDFCQWRQTWLKKYHGWCSGRGQNCGEQGSNS